MPEQRKPVDVIALEEQFKGYESYYYLYKKRLAVAARIWKWRGKNGFCVCFTSAPSLNKDIKCSLGLTAIYLRNCGLKVNYIPCFLKAESSFCANCLHAVGCWCCRHQNEFVMATRRCILHLSLIFLFRSENWEGRWGEQDDQFSYWNCKLPEKGDTEAWIDKYFVYLLPRDPLGCSTVFPWYRCDINRKHRLMHSVRDFKV